MQTEGSRAAGLGHLSALSAVAAAIEESQRKLGCAKCRFSRGGCRRCRNPSFRPRTSPGAAAPAAQAAPTAPGQQPAKARRILKGKRQRKGREGSSEPLLHTLRRQLQELHTQGSAAVEEAPAAAAATAPAASAAAAPRSAAEEGQPGAAAAGAAQKLPQQQVQQQQQKQQQKRAAETGAAGRPAKFFKADPLLVTSLQQEQSTAAAAAVAAAAVSKREASSEPSPSSRRPAKRHRAVDVQPPLEQPGAGAAAIAGPAAAPDIEMPWAAPKRPAAAEQQRAQRPAKFRRVEQQPALAQQQQQRQQQAHPPATAEGSVGSAHMEIDALSPRKRAAAAALERASRADVSPASAAFLAKLEENMQRRHQERQGVAAEPHPLLLASASKRQKFSLDAAGAAAARSPAASHPTAAAGEAGVAAAAEEPDPRLCLWEPPVSPYGLLEEELYDDPWKLLVACMLLNKTTGTQVRKVIWDLFGLCPTPAAALAADVGAIQALVQPLGLFRKRALAIQQLSHDYLYKQWRDPTELFGIGKYAADAYHMFCRGRWREVQPEDKDLKRYLEWLEGTGGLGTGLTRHRTMDYAAPMDA